MISAGEQRYTGIIDPIQTDITNTPDIDCDIEHLASSFTDLTDPITDVTTLATLLFRP